MNLFPDLNSCELLLSSPSKQDMNVEISNVGSRGSYSGFRSPDPLPGLYPRCNSYVKMSMKLLFLFIAQKYEENLSCYFIAVFTTLPKYNTGVKTTTKKSDPVSANKKMSGVLALLPHLLPLPAFELDT